jgi:hypothetical protein
MSGAASFAEAIRNALAEDDSIDMRAVAARAAKGLPQELLLEAAISHLSSMARKYYNVALREKGSEGLSEEVVSLRGVDTRLLDTEADDRDWLARNRETLSEGLRRSAERIRELRGYSLSDTADLSPRDVLRSERQAQQLNIAVQRLQALVAGVEHEVDERVQNAASRASRHKADTERYSSLARRFVDGWRESALTLSRWTRTANAARALEEALQ